MGGWPEAAFCAAWVKIKSLVSSLRVRHAALAPSPPPGGVNIVEVALTVVPTAGWTMH